MKQPRSILILLILVYLFSCAKGENPPLAINGVLDLTTWDPRAGQHVKLAGDWGFHWLKLLAPDAVPESPQTFTKVPKVWSHDLSEHGQLSENGYATYQLKILLNPDLKVKYLIWMPEVTSSLKLWINGSLALENGIVSESRQIARGGPGGKWVLAEPHQGTINLVMQISNHFHRMGGTWFSPTIGEFRSEAANLARSQILEASVVASILIIAFYHIVLYLQHKKSYFNFYFACFCIAVALRTMVVGDAGLMFHLFPQMSWSVARRIEYLGFYLSIPLFAFFMRSLFKEEVKAWIPHAALWPGALLSIIVLVTEPNTFSKTVLLFQGLSVALTIVAIFVLLKAVKSKREGARLFLLAFIILGYVVVQDIFQAHGLIDLFYVTQYGLLTLIFIQATAISERFSKAFKKLELTELELTSLNQSLDKKVHERTAELVKSNIELESAIKKRQEIEAENSSIQSQLFHAEKLATIGTLAAGIAHEINNPLAIVQGYIEVLQKSEKNQSQAGQKAFQVINKAITRIANIVNGLRTYARADTEDITALDIKTVIDDMLVFVQQIIKTTEVTLKVIHEPHPLHAMGSTGKIQQVLVNMVSNACDALSLRSQPRDIVIETKQSNELILILVSDNGHGIPPDICQRIFDPFFTTKGVGKGTGLGLSISNEIIKSFGGNIKVTSTPDVGTTFTISLPQGDAKLERSISPRQQSISKESKKILVVDDEPVIADLLVSHLTSLGHDATLTNSAQKALLILSHETFDLIITDIQMPEMNGFTFLRKATILPSCQGTTFVAMTGGLPSTFSQEDQKILNQVARLILLKPFSLTSLTEALNSL